MHTTFIYEILLSSDRILVEFWFEHALDLVFAKFVPSDDGDDDGMYKRVHSYTFKT